MKDNHPTLHTVAELDRSWVWLPVDLRSDETTRKSIKDYGFIFARNGGHALTSGKTGTWGHSCTAPQPFYRKGKSSKRPSTSEASPTTTETQPADAEALAFAGLA